MEWRAIHEAGHAQRHDVGGIFSSDPNHVLVVEATIFQVLRNAHGPGDALLIGHSDAIDVVNLRI